MSAENTSCFLLWGHLLSLNIICESVRGSLREEGGFRMAVSTGLKTGTERSLKAVSLFFHGTFLLVVLQTFYFTSPNVHVVNQYVIYIFYLCT